MTLATNRIHRGDCIELLSKLEAETVDLAFADPPFNIGYAYDVYHDRQAHDKYLEWSRRWMSGVFSALKPSGTFWLAIGDDYAAELKLAAQSLGLTCRSWVIWYYTFGVNCTRKFSRSHAHLFHFVKDPKRFTFNSQDPAIRVPSARQLVYADSRANPRGRLPDDTWILRPQDVPNGFSEDQDTWYFPRVAGTFKERAGFHGCQMPEQLLGRIVRASSNAGDLVLDPFAGSGTTLAVAKKLGRNWIGFELSPEYARKAKDRIARAAIGSELEGSANPLSSAPSTPSSQSVTRKRQKTAVVRDSSSGDAAPVARTKGYKVMGRNGERYSKADEPVVVAYLAFGKEFSCDQILADPELNAAFLEICAREGAPGTARFWNRALLRLRKAGRLPRIQSRSRRFLTHSQIDPFSFASEIAWQCVESKRNLASLDEILCDPEAATEFDWIAARYAPGYTSFQYRWAALWLRKRASKICEYVSRLEPSAVPQRLPSVREWSKLRINQFAGRSGVYLVAGEDEKIYVGEALNLEGHLKFKNAFDGSIGVQIIEMPDVRDRELHAMKSLLIGKHHPRLNSMRLASV